MTAHAATTITISDTVIAPKAGFGVGVNGGNDWGYPTGANLVNNSCFEGPPGTSGGSLGVSSSGWPWYFNGGSVTASVDTTTFTSGKQSQKLVVNTAPTELQQYRVALPQAPLNFKLLTTKSYIIKAKLKSSAAATIQFGWMLDGGYIYSGDIAINSTWNTYSWTVTPPADRICHGVTLRIKTATTVWVDDLIAWNVTDIDTATGMDKNYLNYLKELKPSMLRWGGLGVNGISLESALLRPWNSSYGPPPMQQDMDLGTFLNLCKAVGANAFVCVPPAFSDAAHAALGDINADVVSNWFQDHGNLVDYIGGDATTTYGAIREAQGFTRFDTQISKIYFELGNEVWGTPDGKWDMWIGTNPTLLDMMNTYATYCQKRMTHMKARPGWRANFKVGFAGRDPTIWIGDWPGSYNFTLVPALKDVTDFSTIGMYYGEGTTTDSNENIYGGLFARAQWHEREIKNFKNAFQTAAGKAIETVCYEGNATWGPGYTKWPAAGAGSYDPMIPIQASAGSAVSILDNYAAANRSGLTFINHFHIHGDKFGILTNAPSTYRRPGFYALKMFNTYTSGNLVTASLSGNGTWNDTFTGETNVPYVSCYPYKTPSGGYAVIVINRHRTAAESVTINKAFAPTQKITLTSPLITDQNDAGEVVTLATQTLPGTNVASYTMTVPAYSAVILQADATIANAAPTVATAASATPNPVTGTTTALSVLGSDDGGEANLKYVWATTGTPPAAVTFSANDTNAAKNATATFTKAGSYSIQVTIRDTAGLTATSSVNVTVNQTLTTITVSPASATVNVGSSQAFTAAGKDQFAAAMVAAPTFAWTVSGGGSINASGNFSATTAGGPFTVTASSGGKSGTASVTVNSVNAAPTVATAASATPNPVTGTTTALTVLGSDDGGEVNLKYVWATTGTPPAAVTFSANNTNAAKSATATFTKAGSYSILVTIRDTAGLTATSSVTVTVNQTLTTITVSPASATVDVGASQTFAAAAKDQFGAALASTPAFAWSVSGGGTISASGAFSAQGPAGAYVVTASSAGVNGTASVTVNAVNGPPAITSAASATPNPALTGQSVSFSVGASDPEGDPLTVMWTFGDGSSATGASVAHPYVAAGTYTATASVSDGAHAAVTSSVTVTVTTPPVGINLAINFQPAGAPIPAGYLADTGVVYGDRGNGQSYGWNAANSTQTRDRNAPNSPDQRYDTLTHLQKPENPTASWEIALPNGSYRVRIVSGDPSHFDSAFRLNAEGVLTVNGNPTATVKWIEGTKVVAVSDGRLTISNAAGGSNNKICFIEIVTATAGALEREAAADAPEAAPLEITKLSLKLDFKTGKKHGVQVLGRLTLPDGFKLAGAAASVDVAAAIEMFALDAKGRAKSKTGSFALKLDKRSKKWTITAKVTGALWTEKWEDGTMTDGSVKKATALIPVTVTINGQAFGGGKTITYSATKGKGGAGK